MALGLEASLGDTVITTKLDECVNWGRQYSLWPFVFGTACCAIEFMSAAASQHDISVRRGLRALLHRVVMEDGDPEPGRSLRERLARVRDVHLDRRLFWML